MIYKQTNIASCLCNLKLKRLVVEDRDYKQTCVITNLEFIARLPLSSVTPPPPSPTAMLLQGRSHRYGWSGFNRTTFQDTPKHFQLLTCTTANMDFVRNCTTPSTYCERVMEARKQWQCIAKHEGATRAHPDN